MSETALPPMPEPKGKTKTTTEPEFVFVENTRTAMHVLRWHDERRKAPAAAHSKFLGPGLNWIPRAALAACTLPGRELGDIGDPTIARVDPTTIREHVAIELAARTGSRQACHAWLKIEKRAAVRKAIEDRLAVRSKAADTAD